MTQYKQIFPLLVGLLVWHSAAAQPSKWGLPSSPNGKLAATLLDAINDDDEATHRALVETHYAPAFKNKKPMEGHLKLLGQMHQKLAGAQLTGVNMMMEANALLSLKMKTPTDEYWNVNVEIAQGASPLIVDLQMEESKEGPPPTDRMIEAVMAAINASDTEAHRAFVDEYFAPAFKNDLPMETHLKLLGEMHQALAGAEVGEVNVMSRGGSDETVSMGVETPDGRRFNVRFDVQLSSPPKLITLSFDEE